MLNKIKNLEKINKKEFKKVDLISLEIKEQIEYNLYSDNLILL